MAKAVDPNTNLAKRRDQARSLSEPEYRRRRADLIDAAKEEFRKKGFHAARLVDIASSIGLDRASLYYYTAGKTALFQEMVQDATLNIIIMAEAISKGTEAPPRQLEAFIVNWFKAYETYYPYLYLYVQEDMSRIAARDTPWNQTMRNLSRRFDRAVVSIIQGGINDGSFNSEIDPKIMAYGIIGMCNWSHRWFKPDEMNAQSIGKDFATMVLNGLGYGRRKRRKNSSLVANEIKKGPT